MLLKPQPSLLRPLTSHNTLHFRACPRRHQSTAQNIISSFLNNKSNPALYPIESTDLLSPTQSHILSLTLQPYIPFPLPNAQKILPQGHHLVYFPTAAVPESRLDSYGTETTYNPGTPFNRRMWAGGRIEWSKEVDLLVGQSTIEKMELDKLEVKQRSGGGEMIVVSIRKTLFTQENSEAVRETREWVFLKDGDASAAQTSLSKNMPTTTDSREISFQHSISLTPAALFRYSALIFNSHAIHLSKEHCSKEGHPNLVVHGPLILSLLLEAVRGTVQKRWKSMTYRAVGPAYVGDIIKLNVGVEKDGKVEAWADKGECLPVMRVTIDFW